MTPEVPLLSKACLQLLRKLPLKKLGAVIFPNLWHRLRLSVYMIPKIPEKHDAHTHMQIHIRVICCRCKCHITNVQHVKIQKWTFSTLKNRGRKGPKANSHDFQWGNVSWWSCSFQTSCSNWPTPIWPLKSPSAVRLGSWAPTAARKARRWRNAKSSMTRSAKKKRNCCTKFGTWEMSWRIRTFVWIVFSRILLSESLGIVGCVLMHLKNALWGRKEARYRFTGVAGVMGHNEART